MKKRKKILGLMVGLSLITLTAGALALTGCHGRHGHSPEKVQRFTAHIVDDALDDVNATDAQVATIQALRKGVVADVLSQRNGHRAAGDALMAELEKATPDAKRVHALIDARAAAMTAVAHRSADALLKAHGVLNADQRAELLKEAKARRARHHR